jgi:glycogen(starch) synthase
MSKENIVIASILKPVLDTRMYEKIGITLASETNYPIHMIGYGKKEDAKHSAAMTTSYLGEFQRLSFTRLCKPFQVLWIAIQRRPTYFIFCTHELLWVANILKVIFPSIQLIYDVQENYYLNIRHQNHYPLVIKIILANYVRLKERLLVTSVSKVIFAEQCYKTELSFWNHKAIVLENKCQASSTPFQRIPIHLSARIRFLFSGTISKSTGILQALSFVKMLHDQGFPVTLVVIGFCPNAQERSVILQELKQHVFVQILHSIDQPVLHTLLVEQIQQAHIGLMPYQLDISTQHKIPTKLYEYLYYQLPIIATYHKEWHDLIQHHHAGVSTSFFNMHDFNFNQFLKTSYYDTSQDDRSLTWNHDATTLWPFLKL